VIAETIEMRLLCPSFEEGPVRPFNKMVRYLKLGAPGEVRTLLATVV